MNTPTTPFPHKLKLFGYWRSSASWRVRWTLQFKEIPFEYVPLNILKGEPKKLSHLARNPLGALPVLEIDGRTNLSESLAIMEWLEDVHPTPAIYPKDPLDRALVRSLCEIINSETAPLQTPRAQNRHTIETDEKSSWARDFIRQGLDAYDKISKPYRTGEFSFGNQLTAADICLIPQLYNATRYQINVPKEFPSLAKIYTTCLATNPCRKASPEQQPDAT
ncbi:MAG: maleylacetoacetate isomerase [Bdellovibrionales bacterium]|nr:maleylacetoacetate isomerase [Bdellovibrionales bacterium]